MWQNTKLWFFFSFTGWNQSKMKLSFGKMLAIYLSSWRCDRVTIVPFLDGFGGKKEKEIVEWWIIAGNKKKNNPTAALITSPETHSATDGIISPPRFNAEIADRIGNDVRPWQRTATSIPIHLLIFLLLCHTHLHRHVRIAFAVMDFRTGSHRRPDNSNRQHICHHHFPLHPAPPGLVL